MSKAQGTARAEPELDEARVAAYLHDNPDFLCRHPDVLAIQSLHHDTGSAASLIERQVGMLRDDNRQLQSRLNEFMAAARGNEQRVVQLNNLARTLLAAANLRDMVTGLADCARREMNVDDVFIGIRRQAGATVGADDGVHLLTDDDPCDDAVTHVFRRGQPVCGPLSAAQVGALFGEVQPAPASAAMVPLGTHGVHGALVLASTDTDRFVPDMGTLFPELLGELVTTALRRYLGAKSLP